MTIHTRTMNTINTRTIFLGTAKSHTCIRIATNRCVIRMRTIPTFITATITR